MIDSPYIVTPSKKVRLKDWPTDETGEFKEKADALEKTQKNLERLSKLQELLYADSKHALLIVFQAMDAGGKDGSISHIFSGVNPQGCMVTSFKVPSSNEKLHDFLWRIHRAAPPRGMIGIFNRSHYESVLVERVKNIVPEKVWSKRYESINNFERMLADEGTIILKFFLHISKDEQKKRLEARLSDPDKNWKFSPSDVAERKFWKDYQEAFEDLLGKCSTKCAPWVVVPSDRKWFRNWVLSDIIVRTLEELDMKYPKAAPGIEKMKVD
ncbi:MAG TPA: polyphosphate kinase 2 family protein [Tepidisphaeraceae bacterium]|nr:polyphosphate kinase 2 family protein [Tepidisphaeraceae bacterium]